MILVQEFHVLDLRIQINMYDPRSFLALLIGSSEKGFGFASHWLKNWRESLKPITKRSNRNHVTTFDSHLKTALFEMLLSYMFPQD